jgi:RHS repeat-associated protein
LLTQEYVITDDQGNARVSFQNNGSGVAVIKQENSYYGFGLLLPNSPVGMSTPPNRFMYKGSEWQNDYSNLPDYYQMYYRNYDQAIGRFVGIDPEPERAESITGYQYAGNNPIMMNDPDGAKATPAAIWQLMQNSMAAEAACQNMGGNMHLAGIGWQDGPAFGGPMPALNEGTYGDGGVGLYYSNPTAYWNYYYATNGTMGGTTLYRAPNSDTGPAIGNLNGAINATPAVLALFAASANGVSGVEVASWNNGTTEVIPTKNGVSYVNVQGQYDGTWYTVWNSSGPTGLAGGNGSNPGTTVTGYDPGFDQFRNVGGYPLTGNALWDPQSTSMIGGVEVSLSYKLT